MIKFISKICLMKLLTCIFSLMWVSKSFAQGHRPNIEIKHLAGNFYIYTAYHKYNNEFIASNGLYLVGNRQVLLIDTPWDSLDFQPLLDRIFLKHHKNVSICFATHFHADRTAGLDYYRQKGIKTYSSEATKKLCFENDKKLSEFTFKNDTSFVFDNQPVKVFYPGAGHSIDNEVLYFEKPKILYGGCFIKSSDATDLGNIADAKISEWNSSLENLKKKFPKIKYVIPGHGSWQDAKGIKHTEHLVYQYLKVNKSAN